MEFNFVLIFNSALLGVGLAMDAFSVSLANGLNEPFMKPRRMSLIAGVFAVFQALMPLIGWFLLHTICHYFVALEKLIPWIALGLLSYIGYHMLQEGMSSNEEETEKPVIGWSGLLLQGIATSIDALSVGFTIVIYNLPEALLTAFIIAVVTFIICMAGLAIGKKAGTKLAGKASIFGGAILIFIGLEIFITSFF